MTREAGFGIGNRWKDYDQNKYSPSPVTYSLNSLFNPNNTTTTFANHMAKGKKTYCFGAGRDDFNKTVNNINNLDPDPCNPGPLAYTPLKPLGHQTPGAKLIFRHDNLDDDVVARKRAIPGPGTYED